MSAIDYYSGLAARYRETIDRFSSVTEGLSDEAFNWKPTEDAWSIGECLHHVNIVNARYVSALREVLDRDELPAGSPPFTYGAIGTWFMNAMDPAGKPMKTSGKMKPPESTGRRSSLEREGELEKCRSTCEAMIGLIEKSRGVDLGKVKMRSPFVWLLRFPVGVFLEALGKHGVRHAMQAERVRKQTELPGSAAPEPSPAVNPAPDER